MLTYDEFAYGVRERLQLKRSELADSALQALWCSLDGDESGFIESGEFHRFVGKSGPPGGTTIAGVRPTSRMLVADVWRSTSLIARLWPAP